MIRELQAPKAQMDSLQGCPQTRQDREDQGNTRKSEEYINIGVFKGFQVL